MKQKPQPKKTIAPKVTAKSNSPEKFIPSHFPNWIYVAIVAFCFALYGNTILNEYALDDTMVLTQNEFVKQGISGIPDIFSYDTFVGRYGSVITNLPGGRYRPLSVATLAIEYDLFAGDEVKKIIADKLNPNKTTYTIPKHLLADFQLRTVDTTLAEVVFLKDMSSMNDDEAPLYTKTILPYVNHFVNILLFAITACFLFKLMWRLFPVRDAKGWKLFFNVPVITLLLFIAHPVHVEALANIKGRDEIMTFLGALMALFYTIRWLDTRQRKYLFITFICFLCGAFSKENAITFLAVIPLTVYFCTSYKLKDNFIALLPSLLAAIIFLIVRDSIIVGGRPEETEFMNNPFLYMRLDEKWASIISILGRYLWLLVFPHPLTTDYYPYHIPKSSFDDIAVWVALAVYMAMFIFMLWSMAPKRKNKYGYAVVWFLFPLSVVSNVFVMIGTFMNERFVYISSVGFCLALAILLIINLPKWVQNVKLYRTIVFLFMGIVVGLYSLQVILRNPDWHDDFKLSTTDVKVSYNSAKANYDAARVYNIEMHRGGQDSLTRVFYTRQIYKYSKRAIEIHPAYENALLLYAWANNVLGMHPDSAAFYPLDQSAKALIQVVKRNQHNPFCYTLLNAVVSGMNDKDQRIRTLEEVCKYAPERADPHYELASIYAKELGLLEKSLPYFEKAVALKPDYYNAIVDLGVLYGMMGNYNKGIDLLENALRSYPNDLLILKNLAAIYKAAGNEQRSMQLFEQYYELGGR